MPLEVGQVFAGYTILRLLGAGGMGRVYLATHPRLPRDDALKVLPTEFSKDPEYRARFAREADVAAGLSHPNIVRIYDRGEHEGQFWISMDYVPGTDVSRLLSERYQSGMPFDEAAQLISAVASALDYAHHRGLLHRDVKPANILITDPEGQSRRIYLADFGIARRMDDSSGLTNTNVAVGTVTYAAPEQLTGDPVDGRADQYALACTAFDLLTGTPPYTHSDTMVVITQHINATPPAISSRRPELAGADPVFATALAKKPEDRFATCGEFAAELSKHLNPYHHQAPAALHAQHTAPSIALLKPAAEPPSPNRWSKRPGVLLGALVGIALLIVGGVFAGVQLTRSGRPATPAAPKTSATVPPSAVLPTTPQGPFTGTYRAEFGPMTDLNGNPAEPRPPVSNTYGVRSLCGGAGCVATASRLQGDPAFATTMVFDRIDTHWLAVALSINQCHQTTGEIWEVFTLQEHPDGTLTGDQTRTGADTCREKRTVTFTRTGDPPAGLLDPGTLPPRRSSPAEAFRGHYQLTRTFVGQGAAPLGDSHVVTNCLRTGDRCMSYFNGKENDVALIFAGDGWTRNESRIGHCPGPGDEATLKATGQYPMPLPLQDPLPVLSGHGTWIQTGSCGITVDYTETFTRTGD